jgi:hypothetical protein
MSHIPRMSRFEKQENISRTLVCPDHSLGRVSFLSVTQAEVALEFETGNVAVTVDLTQLSQARQTALADVLDAIRRRALQLQGFTQTA